jgi:hypothetical protein
MTIVFPKNNLPEPAQPWAREVQKQLANVIASDRANEINNATRDNQLNSSLISLTRVVSDVKIASDEATEALNGLLGLGSSGSEYTINASNINAGSISGNFISGGTITGVIFQTRSSGARISLTATRQSFFNDLGSESGFIEVDGAAYRNGLTLSASGTTLILTSGQAEMAAGGSSIVANNQGVQAFGTFNGNGRIESGGNMRSNGTLGRIALDGDGQGTTGASFNSAGNLVRTASSERYKQDIGELVINYEDLLLLSPKKFRLKEEVIGSEEIEANKNARYYAGFIAEEIAETPLDIFVSYEKLEDGTSRPDGVYYAELTAALLAGIKHQDTLIKSLTERITTLENGAN